MAHFMCQYSLCNTPGVGTDISPHYMSEKMVNEEMKPVTLQLYWTNTVGPLTGCLNVTMYLTDYRSAYLIVQLKFLQSL